MGQPHGLGHGGAVVGNDDERVHAVADEGLHVLELADVVAVGGLHEDVGAEFPDAGGEHVAIVLPALLLERVHGETDDGPVRAGGGRARATAQREADEQR